MGYMGILLEYPPTLGGVLDGLVTERVKTLFLSPLQPRNAGAALRPGPKPLGARAPSRWGPGPKPLWARAPSPCTEAKPVAPTDFFARSAHEEILRNDICFGLWHQLISVRPATPSEVPDGLRDGPDTCRTA